MQAGRTAYRQTPFIQAVCPISVLRSVEFLSRDSRVEVCVFAFKCVHGLVIDIVFRAIEVYSFKNYTAVSAKQIKCLRCAKLAWAPPVARSESLRARLPSSPSALPRKAL